MHMATSHRRRGVFVGGGRENIADVFDDFADGFPVLAVGLPAGRAALVRIRDTVTQLIRGCPPPGERAVNVDGQPRRFPFLKGSPSFGECLAAEVVPA